MTKDIVTIATLTYSRAELLKSQLEASGIECFLSNINVIRSTIGTGVKVKVLKSDMNEALRIVLLHNAEYGKDELETHDIVEDISKVLVPVDFSVYSRNACTYALGIADKLDAEIVLLHSYYFDVMPLVNFSEPYTYQINANQSLAEIKTRAEEEMKRFVDETKVEIAKKGYENLKLKFYLTHGIPEEEILSYSKEDKPGVIIMGTRGHTDNNDLLFGNVTATVLENATVPVLTIPEKTDFMGVNKTNILYATDFDKSDLIAIRKLMTLIYLFDVKIYCVHIGKNEWDTILLDKLKNHFVDYYTGYDIECTLIEADDILKGLQLFIDEKKIDIISMTTHKRNIITRFLKPSLTKQLLFHSQTPMLVFHA